ncbi:MAG TPA: toxin-antitoxin system HicB family antitoxin [Gammaproteobacteria bacterium]|nr:toxin-antitoxin system HicB family antitoxin [Gammaproteobacteria bacterium]
MSIDPYAYNITVRRAMFEGEVCFEARVKELPDLIEYADSPEEAYALAVDGIETTAKMLSEKERVMPVPTSPANDFSGRVTLRVARTLHRSLAEAADEEGVSLNQHLVNILSYYSGFAAGHQADRVPWTNLTTTPKAAHSGSPHLRVVYSSNLRLTSNWR